MKEVTGILHGVSTPCILMQVEYINDFYVVTKCVKLDSRVDEVDQIIKLDVNLNNLYASDPYFQFDENAYCTADNFIERGICLKRFYKHSGSTLEAVDICKKLKDQNKIFVSNQSISNYYNFEDCCNELLQKILLVFKVNNQLDN